MGRPPINGQEMTPLTMTLLTLTPSLPCPRPPSSYARIIIIKHRHHDGRHAPVIWQRVAVCAWGGSFTPEP